jgi:predicted esterase
VRGGSAGAWLAVAAALQRPDLFAGAIGISGAYIFSEDRLVAGGQFFSPDDSFDRSGRLARANCAILQFRFLYARDDPVTGFDQAERFVEMLEDRGCAAELVAFDVGGHTLSRTLTPQDSRREIEGYNTPLVDRER